MHYFVKRNVIHTYPVGRHCTETYGEEQVRDTVPHGATQCIYCLHRWPEDEA